MEPRTLTRSASFSASADRLWAQLADDDGLSGWLAESVQLAVVPGAAGRAVDDDVVRRIVVTEVDAGRSLGFTWWDETAPTEASTVVLRIDETADGGSVLSITETLDPSGGRASALASASVADLAASDDAWTDRLARLLGVVEPALVAVGA